MFQPDEILMKISVLLDLKVQAIQRAFFSDDNKVISESDDCDSSKRCRMK